MPWALVILDDRGRAAGRSGYVPLADGTHWLTAGEVEFAVEDPVEVGLYALGMIDRTMYHGAYPEGTAIRFESFDLWSA